MLNERDILNLLEEYVRTLEAKKWLKDSFDVSLGSDTQIVDEIRNELISAIRTVLPGFRFDLIQAVKSRESETSAEYEIRIGEDALRRESLYYTTKNGVRRQGEGIDDILALFTHGYTLKHRAPYGMWDRSDGTSVAVRALAHRDANPFLENLCNYLNARYDGICEITLNDDYKR